MKTSPITTEILLERVVKAITDLENKMLQTIAWNECFQAAQTTGVDLARAVHAEVDVRETVIETMQQNPDSFGQWANFQKALDDYTRCQHENQENQ